MADDEHVPDWYRQAVDGPGLEDLSHTETLAYVICNRRVFGGGFNPTLLPPADDKRALLSYYHELGAVLGHGRFGATVFLKIAAFEPGRAITAPIHNWRDNRFAQSADRGGVYAAYGTTFAVVQDDSGQWHRYGVPRPQQGRVHSVQALADMTGRAVVVGRRLADVDLY